MNFRTITQDLRTEADAYAFLERLRWPSGTPTCPHCDNEGAWYLAPKNGGRRTRMGKVSERRVWKCKSCRKQFSVLTGTVMHGTKIPVRSWVFVIFEMCSSKNGVSAREIERKYGVCPRSAWFMLHRVREAMRRDPLVAPMSGVVTADETWIGGKEQNKHQKDRYQPDPPTTEPTKIVPGKRRPQSPGPQWKKVAVLSLIDSKGEVRSRIIPDVTGATLRKAIAEQVDMPATELHTDEHRGYNQLRPELLAHRTVNHSEDEYAVWKDGSYVNSNLAENFFSQLKRSIDGTHHHVSREHLDRYLAEFDFRYSTRKNSDAGRMADLMERLGGKRLTYKRVAGG